MGVRHEEKLLFNSHHNLSAPIDSLVLVNIGIKHKGLIIVDGWLTLLIAVLGLCVS